MLTLKKKRAIDASRFFESTLLGEERTDSFVNDTSLKQVGLQMSKTKPIKLIYLFSLDLINEVPSPTEENGSYM